MRIVLDAMGSDTHPAPEVRAAELAYQRWGDTITLVGPQEQLEEAFKTAAIPLDHSELVHAPQVLEMTDKPARTARGKARTSMAVGMELLKDGRADAFVTAGNTGGAMATALFTLGRLRGLKRPALAPTFPVRDGHVLVLDIGANADCKPEYLLQFATMGVQYAKKVFDIQDPRVGLLSNGEEAGKGNALLKETFPLMESLGVRFIGNVEPKEVYAGFADVVITDGFTGNVFLKTSEAVAGMLIDLIRSEIKTRPLTALGGLLAKPAFRRVGRILDPAEYGAAPLLGVEGLVFIGHGRSDERALLNAIRIARQAVKSGVLESTRAAIREQLAASMDAAQ